MEESCPICLELMDDYISCPQCKNKYHRECLPQDRCAICRHIFDLEKTIQKKRELTEHHDHSVAAEFYDQVSDEISDSNSDDSMADSDYEPPSELLWLCPTNRPLTRAQADRLKLIAGVY